MVEPHTIEMEDCGTQFRCPEGEGVLQAMERQGRRAIPVGCRNGGCGLCLVKITEGQFRAGPMSRRHVPAEHSEQGFALACRVYPQSDLRLRLATTSDRQSLQTECPSGQKGR